MSNKIETICGVKDAKATMSISPFQDGVIVVLADVMSARIKRDGKWSDPYAVFSTNIGTLWPTMLGKAKVDTDGGIHRPQKGFSTLWADIISALRVATNDSDGLADVVKKYKNKGFRIVREEFPAKTSDGRPYVGAVIDSDIVDLDEEAYKKEINKAKELQQKLEEAYKKAMGLAD